MPKSSKKTEQSSSYRSADSGPTTHKTKLDGPPKNTKKKKDGGGTNKKQKLSKKELKELEKQQRQKSYIAPTKPQPIKPDPLDSTGLAYVLPGELVIVLRNLGKKAVKTREKALDDLESGWVNSDRTKESSGQEHILIDMLPVWLSHLPQLLLHASRRIRLTATNIHRSLVNMPTILEHIKLQLEADGSESADVIGVWALASQDIDPAVASSASESWRKFVGASLSKAKILTYAQRAIVDPGALYAYLNPSPLRTPAPIPHDKLTGNQKTQIHSKGFDDPPLDSLETDTDRDARLRVSGLGALAWVLSASSYLAETLDILSDARLWSSLAGYDFASFGFEQPPVRRAAWRLVGTSSPSTDEKISTLLRILSFSVFHSAWTEQDASVQGVMWQPLLRFLKDVDAGSDSGLDSDSESNSSDDEDEDVRKETEVPHSAASRAFKSFLSFLACGCNGSPIQSYPAVMVILSTIPSNILLASYSSESIPSPTMPFTDLFSSFWAAVEPNHHPSLSPNKASKAFVEAVLDCLTFLVRRTVSQSQNATSKTAADILGLSTLIRTQIKRVWVELVLRISPDVLGTSLARMLRGLRGIPEGPFYDDAWETVTRLIQDSAIEVSSASTSIAVKDLSSFTSGMLKALQPSSVDSTDSTHSDAQQLLVTVFNIALDGCERSVTGLNGSVIKGIGGLHLLTKLISTFDSETGTAAASDGVTIRIDTFVVQNAYKVLSLEGKEGLELLATYLLCRDPHPTFRPTESSQAALTWLALLEQVVEHFHSQSGSQKAAFPVVLSYLLTLLDSLKSKRGGKVMVVKLRPIMNELDDMILEFAQDTVASGLSTLSSKLNLVRDVLLLTHRAKIAETISHPLLVPASLVKLVGMLQSKPGPSSSYTASLPALPSTSVIPGIFLLAYALPRSSLSPQSELASTEDGTISHSRDNLCAKAQRIWESSIKFNKDVYSGAKDQPYHEIYSVFPNSVDLEKNPINALLPSQESLDALLDGISGAPISRSLGVVDELAGAASTFDPSSFAATSDINDVRIYARYALALLHILSSDLGLAKRLFTASSGSWWALRHLFVLGVYARGIVSVPNAPNALYRNPLYHLSVLESERVHRCREIIGKVHRIVAYVFASAEIAEGATAGEGREWRKDVCRMLPAPDEASPALPFLAAFLFSIVRFAAKTDSYRDCCVLREVLSRLFQTGLGSGGRSEISEEEANLWLNYARRLSEPEKGESARAPLTGVTIMSTLVANLPSSSSSSPTLAAIFSFPHLERYRNELASSLLGVSPSRATSDGLRILLRLVLGTAPDIQSEAEFLPVQRAVNVIKACQKWIEEGGDDDDASDEMEELESAMTLTFYHLAPILQNVAGGHWQFIFDVVENNIESFSASTSSLQLITLARTIRLVGHIQDLAATNKSLRAEWSERKGGIMKGVRRMILLDKDTAEEESEASKRESDDRMCHLLSSSTYSYVPYPSTHSHSSSSSLSSFASSIHHDQLAYQILYKATKKRTEYFVLEAGVDTEGKVKAQLPEELLVLLQQSVDLDIDVENADIDGDREHVGPTYLDSHHTEIFVYLLSWMLFFDSFVDTSMKVRMSYIEQLRSSSIIETHFIPSVLNLLNLGRGIVKAYKLDIWAVDEFYVQFYEAGSFSGLQTFAAHLYYRALLTVPSLIYSWVVDCRDRQLSSTIASYTQSHFSPVLIRAELEHVKGPEAQSEFASESDENQLTVKVASGAVNEVTASYLVDEQQLEIRLRIPGDWPLHRIEIRDTKKVGVDDNRWRAWILGVQQTIWAQNGRILDGLALFKKNVAGHFQGQVECAICYSLISVMDGSLPKKPCNTCKNRFHAGCLFKWFNSSHSSSCPLCRSDILH
ncbi:hypothetical protein F5876DRAFT_46635 [Lentinula aff. lateritia]|uniref:Uncharacterized protein n=1 Tax=Lentinula aff. lateritia TaxID=2804960 RepID=A0ACC1TTN1_9AGAR|nr:hypothetical protein F5876DRAFT_46635 [Lentinula aff. lateritia]